MEVNLILVIGPAESESRTEDNQDSKDHFCGPLNKRNDTKISGIFRAFLECFVGKPSVAASPPASCAFGDYCHRLVAASRSTFDATRAGPQPRWLQLGAIRSSKLQSPNPKQIPISKSQSNPVGCVLFWSLEFEICLKLGAWVLGFQLRAAIGQIRRNPRRFLIRHESRTEDNQDSKDYFFRPTKQTKRHENQLHSFVLFRVFRGQTSGCGFAAGYLRLRRLLPSSRRGEPIHL